MARSTDSGGFARPAPAFALAVVVALGVMAVPAETGGMSTQAVVDKLQGWLDGTRDLRCRFEQRIVSGALGSGPTERGTVALLRPGHMRWDYDAPEKKVALVTAGRTLVYLPEEKQLIRGRLDGEGGAFAVLLTGQGRVGDMFSPLLVAVPRKDGAGDYRLRLAPRSEEQGLEAVMLTLRPPDFSIQGAEVIDPAGNVIEYRFDSLRRNQGVSEKVFQFEPPAGTEIVEAASQ